MRTDASSKIRIVRILADVSYFKSARCVGDAKKQIRYDFLDAFYIDFVQRLGKTGQPIKVEGHGELGLSHGIHFSRHHWAVGNPHPQLRAPMKKKRP